MSYRKTVKGDSNQANEVNSHNRIIMDTGHGFTVFAWYLALVTTAAIVFVALKFGEYLGYAIMITVSGAVLYGWYWLVCMVRRTTSHTNTTIQIDRYRRDQAWLESRVAVREALYALYLDENDNLQFRDTKQITENRHFPAQIEAPKDKKDTILGYYDASKSARSVEKWVNADREPSEKKISYHEIGKVLDLYRPGWRESGKKVIDAEEYPVDE